MLRSKKILSFALSLSMILGISSAAVHAAPDMKIGDYAIVGKYNDEPILWRYIADDDNGMLFFSDKILCKKTFGLTSATWKTSSINAWLNCDTEIGLFNPETGRYRAYANESGFLYDTNFTAAQRDIMKTVSLWSMTGNPILSENGITDSYLDIVKKYPEPEDPKYPKYNNDYEYYTLDDIPNIYYGAAQQSENKVFLLDEMQLYTMRENLGTVSCSHVPDEDEPHSFYLRSNCVNASTYDGFLFDTSAKRECGIRPAFYLNTDAIDTITGSGTLEDPFILNASQNVTVSLNNELLTFDVEPMIENDRVLVPFRKIFEALGAEVEWYGDTRTVTATKDGLDLTLQIDDPEMKVNGEPVMLDVAPKIAHERTLVPIRAVSEALNGLVDWDDTNRQVIIVTQ